MGNRDDNEPFLSRWSRRKRGQATAKGEPAGAPHATDDAAGESEPGEGSGDEAALDLSKLPRLEDMTADTDITAFLDRRVPAALRNAALSRMWTLDPTIRDFIEVAELQWNWNIPGGAPFYEVIEPGSAASALAGDASSAIVRALNDASRAPDAQLASTAGAGEAGTTQKIDRSPATDTAPQHDGGDEPHSASHMEGGEPERNPGDKACTVTAAAPQHETDTEPRPARRHGGALPF